MTLIPRDATLQAHVVQWETLLASGTLLMGVTPRHFSQFHRAILDGVFEPNSVLSKAEVNRIGAANCTSSSEDALIGVRRFERTLTMAPEFMAMTDENGLHLQDWLLALQREDLLLTLRLMPPFLTLDHKTRF